MGRRRRRRGGGEDTITSHVHVCVLYVSSASHTLLYSPSPISHTLPLHTHLLTHHPNSHPLPSHTHLLTHHPNSHPLPTHPPSPNSPTLPTHTPLPQDFIIDLETFESQKAELIGQLESTLHPLTQFPQESATQLRRTTEQLKQGYETVTEKVCHPSHLYHPHISPPSHTPILTHSHPHTLIPSHPHR